MKRIFFLIAITLVFSCSGKNTADTDTGKKKDAVLKIEALRDFKQSREGATLLFAVRCTPIFGSLTPPFRHPKEAYTIKLLTSRNLILDSKKGCSL